MGVDCTTAPYCTARRATAHDRCTGGRQRGLVSAADGLSVASAATRNAWPLDSGTFRFIAAEGESGGDTWALKRSVSRSRRHRPEAALSFVSLALPALPTASRNRPVSAVRSSGPVCRRYSCKCAASLWECVRTPLARPSASARRAILRTRHPAPRTTRPPAGECAAAAHSAETPSTL